MLSTALHRVAEESEEVRVEMAVWLASLAPRSEGQDQWSQWEGSGSGLGSGFRVRVCVWLR